MPTDLKVQFVEMLKSACEKFLASPDSTTLGWNHDFEIESIELLPADKSEEVGYVTVVRNDDGSYSEVGTERSPFMFRVRYWNEYGDGVNSPCHPEKILGLCEVLTEVGKLIAGQADLSKACMDMRVLRGDPWEVLRTIRFDGEKS